MSFRFKQFAIDDSRCAMKVGTDGVLLGAWAQAGHARHILDVGTGSGLIAIMMAQRFEGARITGIDIDREAVTQAAWNMESSPWRERLAAKHCNFLEWREQADAIVCNPPFFQSSLRCPDSGRAQARHDDALPLLMLGKKAADVLPQGGTLSVILPADTTFQPSGLKLRRQCLVQTVEGKKPKRKMMEFVKGYDGESIDETLLLMQPDGQRSPAHHSLTRDFYL